MSVLQNKKLEVGLPTGLNGLSLFLFQQGIDLYADVYKSQNIKRLEEYGYIRKNGSEYEPTIVIFKEGGTKDYINNFSESGKADLTLLTEEIRAEFKEAADFINKIIYNDLPASLKNEMCIRDRGYRAEFKASGVGGNCRVQSACDIICLLYTSYSGTECFNYCMDIVSRICTPEL